MSGGSKKQTVGYRYLFTIQMGLGRGPVDEIVEMKAGDILGWQGSITENAYGYIKAPGLFGGDKKEGGIDGAFEVLMGFPWQEVTHPPLKAILTTLTGFRGRVTIAFDGVIGAMNPYPKKWAWRVRRALKGWDGPVLAPSYAVITLGSAPPSAIVQPTRPNEPVPPPDVETNPEALTAYYIEMQRFQQEQERFNTQPPVIKPNGQIKAMNGAHIIFEALTNRPWGRGLSYSAIDTPSFEQAAQTLFNEGFGLCMAWKRQDSIESFVQAVLDTIGAVLYVDRRTALLTLKLIRADYVRSELPLYTTGNGILEISDAAVSTASGSLNEVIVNYRDPVSNEMRSVRAQNLASLQSSNGEFKSKTVEFKGVPTGSLALRLAQRELRANAEGLRRFKFTMDRRGWRIAPGSVIRIEDPLRKIPDTVVRVAHVEDGTLVNGKITVTGVQDVFSLPATSFVEEEPNRYEPPVKNACVGEHKVFEIPYIMLVRNMSAADFQTLDNTSAYFGAVVDQGTNQQNVAYDTAVRTSAVTPDDWPSSGDSYCGYTPPTP